MYLGLINYMEALEETELNLIFDRTFIITIWILSFRIVKVFSALQSKIVEWIPVSSIAERNHSWKFCFFTILIFRGKLGYYKNTSYDKLNFIFMISSLSH